MSLSTTSSLLPTEAELNSYQVIAKVAASNPHWRKLGGNGSEESVIATILSVMLLARELGISPMQSISGGINNILGKFEISARIMNQLIRKNGHSLSIRVMNEQMCVIWGKRKDTAEEMEVTYHIEEAMRAGLVKEGSAWKKVPTDMLFARCISRIARRLFADCIGGCYVEGELQESMAGASMKVEDIKDIQNVKKDVQIEAQAEIVLNLPDTVDKEEVQKYILEISVQTKKSIEEIKRGVQARMESFLGAFEAWRKKNLELDSQLYHDEVQLQEARA